jgi:CheY-like chemotaxis protein
MIPKTVTVLLAEDDPEDRYLIDEALSESRVPHKLIVVEDGDEMLDYLNNRGKYEIKDESPRPGLILLDLSMPRRDGWEVLEEIKRNPDLRRIPVVVLTNSHAEEDILRAYELGVSGYVSKPVSYMGLLNAMKTIGSYWLEINRLPPS